MFKGINFDHYILVCGAHSTVYICLSFEVVVNCSTLICSPVLNFNIVRYLYDTKRSFLFFVPQVLAEAQKISVNNLVLPDAPSVGITDDSSLCTDSARVGIPEASEDISTKAPRASTEIKPEIRMSRRTRRKYQMQCKTKHVSCNEDSDNLQVVYAIIYEYSHIYILS